MRKTISIIVCDGCGVEIKPTLLPSTYPGGPDKQLPVVKFHGMELCFKCHVILNTLSKLNFIEFMLEF